MLRGNALVGYHAKEINEKLSGLQNMGKGSHISSGLTDHLSSCTFYKVAYLRVRDELFEHIGKHIAEKCATFFYAKSSF